VLPVLKHKHHDHQPVVGSTVMAGLGLLAVIWIAYLLGEPMIRERWEETRTQVAEARTNREADFRVQLYADTWRMAKERWLWGWGLGSYPVVFQDFNTQRASQVDRLPKFFHDAHSDWLQALAEKGFAGTVLIGLSGLLPLWVHRRSLSNSPVTWYGVGCGGLLLAYAWVEFPFGNAAVVCAFWTVLFTACIYGRIDADSPAL
jgi:O-antigen ligase